MHCHVTYRRRPSCVLSSRRHPIIFKFNSWLLLCFLVGSFRFLIDKSWWVSFTVFLPPFAPTSVQPWALVLLFFDLYFWFGLFVFGLIRLWFFFYTGWFILFCVFRRFFIDRASDLLGASWIFALKSTFENTVCGLEHKFTGRFGGNHLKATDWTEKFGVLFEVNLIHDFFFDFFCNWDEESNWLIFLTGRVNGLTICKLGSLNLFSWGPRVSIFSSAAHRRFIFMVSKIWLEWSSNLVLTLCLFSNVSTFYHSDFDCLEIG